MISEFYVRTAKRGNKAHVSIDVRSIIPDIIDIIQVISI